MFRNGSHNMWKKKKVYLNRFLRENKCLGYYHERRLYRDIVCVYLGESVSGP